MEAGRKTGLVGAEAGLVVAESAREAGLGRAEVTR